MSRLCRMKSYKNIGDDGKWAYSEIMQLRQQLAESQARETRLREMLQRFADVHGYVGKSDVADALALPHDDTALREYRESVIEGCIATLEQAKIKTDNHLLRPGLHTAIKEIKLYEEAVRNISKGV